MKMSITLDVPKEQSSVAIIRHTARCFLENRKAAPQDVDDVETLVGELSSNVTRHAYSHFGHFLVTLEHEGNSVVVIVTDWGRGMDRAAVPAVGTVRQDEDGTERFGGFGLLLAERLADRVEYSQSDPTGTTVRAEKRIPDTARAD